MPSRLKPPDATLAILALLLSTSLILFAAGIIPYPIGWMVLSALLFARILAMAASRNRDDS